MSIGGGIGLQFVTPPFIGSGPPPASPTPPPPIGILPPPPPAPAPPPTPAPPVAKTSAFPTSGRIAFNLALQDSIKPWAAVFPEALALTSKKERKLSAVETAVLVEPKADTS